MATTTKRGANLIEKMMLGAIGGGAAAIAATEAVFLVRRIVDLVTPGPTTLNGMPLNEPLEAEIDSPAVTEAAVRTIDLTVAELPDAAVAPLVVAAILGSLLTIGICAVVAWLCVRVFLGKPFVRSATWGIGVAAILVILAGLGTPLFTGIAYAETALALDITELAPFMVEIDVAPLGWAFALIVVAAAFEIGQRLQRETTGLI